MSEDIETRVASHYTTDAMLDAIRKALTAAGVDPDAPHANDLKPVDEFHTGGLEATDALLDQLEITPETRVLDIGCGIGGAARHVAGRSGAHVTAFDLTPEFITTAKALSALVGLDDKNTFGVGSALDMPVADNSADLALMFHVGMNIEDKKTLFSEAARALSPGGIFAIFDVMKTSDAPMTFPFPWADEKGFSFVDTPQTYRDAATAAGFTQMAERNRRDFAIAFFERAFAAMEKNGGPPSVGIHLLMRETAPLKIKNYFNHAKAGDIAPVEMIFRAPG